MKQQWKGFTLDDFVNYYNKNYKGLSPGQVQDVDKSFHDVVSKRGLYHEMPWPRLYRDFTNFTRQDFINYYYKHYEGYTRTDLQGKDEYFYQLLRKKKIIKNLIPRAVRKGRYSNLTDEQLFASFLKRYPNETRGSQKFKGTALYGEFRRRNLRKRLPSEYDLGLRHRWKGKGIEYLRKYYFKHHRDKSSEVVSKDDSGFYKHLSRIGKIREVIRK